MSLNLDFISSEFNLSVERDSGRLVYLFEGTDSTCSGA